MSTQHPHHELEISLDDEDTDHHLGQPAAPGQRHAGPDADDLPVLTDVVDERLEPFIGETTPIILEPVDTEPAIALADTNRVERFVSLDTAISRHIEDWIATELPQLVSRELDELAERLSHKAAAHLRATLLPLVSAEISEALDRKPDA